MDNWPEAAGNLADFVKKHFTDIEQKISAIYNGAAYQALSIEGYSVSDEMITRINRGEFDPLKNLRDRSEADAMAALGYHEAFLLVKERPRKIHLILRHP